ncbi:hypothetical protein CB0940_02932 [Cercospora beticola]|uniref:Heterokaryon incompatibility domain-containing protein n=2 Tax=Cercospora beticola TaxID=122368 RepID=A0A2G5I461_CERBT|nr:hypothetical protein CB0940_02932 [Cercospora beticola]PIA99282.1 hypothetical protein CB0940_02932 [Cercospora beticola]
MISSNTSSDQALSWVQEQINACTHSHAQCQRKQGEFLPTRLLSVRPNPGSQDIRLIESKNLPSSARYIALSHCWGKIHMQCLTKKENLLQQLECVPWSSLTRTFQDAVDFTRRLGIDYIWIDSMCIVQNDTEDWLREASMMFSVYGNAHVTLVGVHAGDGSVGLYSSTAAQRASPKTVAFNGHDYQLYTREATTPFHDWRQISSEAPLFGRAWCFQELIISSRVVFFTKQELLWECWSNASCECTCPASNSTQDIDNLKVQHFAALADAQYDDLRERVIDKTNATSFRLSSVPSAAARGLADEQLRREYRVHQWHSVVEQYSELRLTKYTDRLPAFGGVAQHYHEAGIRPGEKYLAGLWSGSIIDDLVWWAMEFGRKRLGAGVAPSWSWASVTGAVQYKQVKVALAKVLSAECEYGNTGPFSVVSGGMLGVEGPTLRLTLLQKERTRDWSLDDPEYGELTGLSTFLLDDEADSACWNRRTIDAVAFAEAWDGQTIYILLAAKDHKVDVYTRVGILFQDDTDDRIRTWREKLPRRSFRVV